MSGSCQLVIFSCKSVRRCSPRKCKHPFLSALLRVAVRATHGVDCALQHAQKTVISPNMRERVLVELWRKLTGDECSSPHEIYREARHIW